MNWAYRKKGSKFGAVKTADGFPSMLERAVYQLLLIRAAAGELKNIKRQAAVRLKEKCELCGDGPVTYKVDFSAEEVSTGNTIYIEAKGVETADFKKRKRLWKANPPAKLEIWKGSHRYPKLDETIEPNEISTALNAATANDADIFLVAAQTEPDLEPGAT